MTVKFAIVGSSKALLLTSNILNELDKIFQQYTTHDILISGGAVGIDTFAKDMAEKMNTGWSIHRPKHKNWQFYRVRNIEIAEECDVLYNIVIKGNKEFCYHCNSATHNRSGACWTMKYAKSIGKPVYLIEVDM